MAGPSATRAPTSIFYGWWMVATAFLAQGVSAGCTIYIFGLFLKPMSEEFGTTRGTISLGISIFIFSGGVIAPFLGPPLDRGKIRGVMAAGLIALSGSLVLLSVAPSLWVLGLVAVTLLAFATSAAGPLSASKLVANWFEALRGRALGIAATGTSAGGTVFPPLVAWAIVAWGWRGALLALGAGVAVVALPPVLLLVRSRPEDLGLAPDGRAAAVPADGAPGAVAAGPSIGVREIVRDRNFWALGFSIGLCFAVLTGVLLNLHPYATDAGFDNSASAFLVTILAASGICGKLAFGTLADRVSKRLLMAIAIAMLGFLLLVLLAKPGYGVLAGGAGLAGFAIGGFLPLWGALIGDCWGREAFARVMALMTPLMTPLNMAGMAYPGLIYDRTGSYDLAFQSFVGVLGLAAVCLAFLRPPRRA